MNFKTENIDNNVIFTILDNSNEIVLKNSQCEAVDGRPYTSPPPCLYHSLARMKAIVNNPLFVIYIYIYIPRIS